VEGITTPYRYFRILQTGHNSSNRNYLVLSGFEIYGELFEDELTAPVETKEPASLIKGKVAM
jgi:hypothetical protein